MPGATLLELRIAAKRFAQPGGAAHAVLRDVGFALAPGEVLALLAPSGTGKSTTLRIALGLDTDFTGSVRRGWRRPGTMFQEPRLLPWLDVAGNIGFVRPPGAAMPDVAALLALVGLPDIARQLPRALSLGMARRVALARALAVAPDLLVLDEPFASLDPRLTAELAGRVIAGARTAGAGVLLATHDLVQAIALADRVLVLAGHPATLAADIAVPGADRLAARQALAADLVARFGFLRAGGDAPLDFPPAHRNKMPTADPHGAT